MEEVGVYNGTSPKITEIPLNKPYPLAPRAQKFLTGTIRAKVNYLKLYIILILEKASIDCKHYINCKHKQNQKRKLFEIK